MVNILKYKRTSHVNVLIVTICTVLSKIIALFRQIVLTYYYGTTNVSDAYILAQSIPEAMFLLISSAIGVSFIPVFLRLQKENGDKEANKFTSNIINIVIIICSILVILTLIFAKQIVFLFASGFDEETASLANSFLRISIFSIYFIGLCGIYGAYLKIKGDFFSPSVIGISLSVIEILSYVIAAHTSDYILAIGITVAALSQWIILLVSCSRYGFHHKVYIDLKNSYLKQAILMSLPIMIGVGIDEINVIVDRTIASNFIPGSISALTYGNTIAGIVHTVISVSINTVLFTEVTALSINNEKVKITERIYSALERAMFLLIPATIGLIMFSQQIVRLLFGRGNFSETSIITTSGVMVFYALYIIPNGIRIIIQSYFYAYGKTKFCMYVGIIAVILNICMNIFLSRFIGINGLALATSMAVIISTVILFISFYKENKQFRLRSLLRQTMKMLAAGGIMITSALLAHKYMLFIMPEIVSLMLSITLACIVYFACALTFKIFSIHDMKLIIKRKKA